MKQGLLIALIFGCYVAQSQVTQLDLLGRWMDSTLVGSTTYDNAYNEVWGVAIDDKEYAIIGSTFGTHFIDVTDPTNPVEVVRVPGRDQGAQIIHRDYHDYGCYLYAVSDEGASSLQIMDLSQLPDAVPVVYDDASLISRSHNIFIDSASAKLYSLATRGQTTGPGALQVFDISNPIDPQFIGTSNRFGNINAGHVHDGYVHQDTAYLNCGFDGLAIVDFSDPTDPVAINTLRRSEYPFSGYNHSCWRSDDGRALYMADETWDAPIKVVSLENYADLEVVGTFDADNPSPFSIPHNQVVACNYLFVSYYYDGLQVYDITDPLNPVREYFYPTTDKDPRRNYEGAWGVYPLLPSGNILVSDMQEGLFVIQSLDENCNDVKACPTTVDVDQVANDAWEIYPNPAFHEMIIHSETDATMQILTADGKSVITRRLRTGSNIIEVHHLPSGLYFVEINGATKRLIIQ